MLADLNTAVPPATSVYHTAVDLVPSEDEAKPAEAADAPSTVSKVVGLDHDAVAPEIVAFAALTTAVPPTIANQLIVALEPSAESERTLLPVLAGVSDESTIVGLDQDAAEPEIVALAVLIDVTVDQ